MIIKKKKKQESTIDKNISIVAVFIVLKWYTAK